MDDGAARQTTERADRLERLAPGQPVIYGGDRVTHVGAGLAAAFRAGDRLVVVQDDGALLHVPAAQHALASHAVDRALTAFQAMGEVADAQITAFFEAFPSEGGFFRGEGETLVAAEADCLEKYRRFTACDHLWGRGTYTNGGAICRRCRAFMTRFHPIPRLGKHLDPISVMELDLAMDGACRPGRRPDPAGDRYARRLSLRLARAGIRLPDHNNPHYPEACRDAVLCWYRENRDRTDRGETSGMAGLFDTLALRRLEAEAADA